MEDVYATKRDERFWQIVQSAEFRNLFVDRHPLLFVNYELYGGDYYRLAALHESLRDVRTRAIKSHLRKDMAMLSHSIRVHIDWIEQVAWLDNALSQEGL